MKLAYELVRIVKFLVSTNFSIKNFLDVFCIFTTDDINVDKEFHHIMAGRSSDVCNYNTTPCLTGK